MKQHIKPCICKTCIKARDLEYQKGFIDASQKRQAGEIYARGLKEQRDKIIDIIEKEKKKWIGISKVVVIDLEKIITKIKQ